MIKIRYKYWQQISIVGFKNEHSNYYATKQLADKINKREYTHWLEKIKSEPNTNIEEEYKLESALCFSYSHWNDAQRGTILKRASFSVYERNIEYDIKECDGQCASRGDFCDECMEK